MSDRRSGWLVVIIAAVLGVIVSFLAYFGVFQQEMTERLPVVRPSGSGLMVRRRDRRFRLCGARLAHGDRPRGRRIRDRQGPLGTRGRGRGGCLHDRRGGDRGRIGHDSRRTMRPPRTGNPTRSGSGSVQLRGIRHCRRHRRCRERSTSSITRDTVETSTSPEGMCAVPCSVGVSVDEAVTLLSGSAARTRGGPSRTPSTTPL